MAERPQKHEGRDRCENGWPRQRAHLERGVNRRGRDDDAADAADQNAGKAQLPAQCARACLVHVRSFVYPLPHLGSRVTAQARSVYAKESRIGTCPSIVRLATCDNGGIYRAKEDSWPTYLPQTSETPPLDLACSKRPKRVLRAPQSFSAHARSPRASPSRQTRRACSLGRFSAS